MGFIHIPTGIYFENRKQAVILMGINRYKRFLANKEFQWDKSDNYITNYKNNTENYA